MTHSSEPPDGSDRTRATIPIRYVVEMLSSLEVDRSEVLAEASIPLGALDHERYRVSGVQVEALYHALMRRSGDELYGVFHHPVPRGGFATLATLLAETREIRGALRASIDFYALFDGGHAHWRLDEAEGRAELSLRPRTPAQTQSLLFAHAMLLSPWRTASWLAGEAFTLVEMILDARFADYVPETRYLFGVDPALEPGRCAIVFDRAVLDWPVRRTRDEALAWTRRASFAAMIAAAPRDSLEAAVRGALASASPFAGARLPDVAKQLGMSQQTLARRLRDQALSFQQIKDDLRRDQAIALLSKGRTVGSVAEELGFSEPSAFGRAFKAWTGVSPGRWG